MAKRKRAAARTTTKIVRVPSGPAPVIKVSAPRAPTRRRTSRRRSSGGHNIGGLISNETLQMAIGGAGYGFLVKSGIIAKLPAIPILGRTGTAAILLDYWSRHGGGPLAARAARAAASIAGYQLGAEGAIQGLDDNAATPGSMAGDFAMGDDMEGYDADSYPG